MGSALRDSVAGLTLIPGFSQVPHAGNVAETVSTVSGRASQRLARTGYDRTRAGAIVGIPSPEAPSRLKAHGLQSVVPEARMRPCFRHSHRSRTFLTVPRKPLKRLFGLQRSAQHRAEARC